MCLASPFISLSYLCRVIRLSPSWRLLTDVYAWLRSSQTPMQRARVHDFLVINRKAVRHCTGLHAKAVIGSRSAMLGSANLTDAGILRQTEVSALFNDEPQVHELAKWFESCWCAGCKLTPRLLDHFAAFMGMLPEESVLDEIPDPGISLPRSTRPASLAELPDVPPNNGPSNGEVYFNYGHGEGWREWEDARLYGFICAGGDPGFSTPLLGLDPRERLWVYVPRRPGCVGHGYVGVARVTGPRQRARDFSVTTPDGKVRRIMDVLGGRYANDMEHIDDADRCEYFVPVRWIATRPLEWAVAGPDLFANRKIVCRPTTPIWRHTLRRLMKEFPNYNQ